MVEEKALTIFDALSPKEKKEAIQSFITGHTPASEIKKRQARGGGEVNYVNGYWMFRQASLITGFRWSHDILAEQYRPNQENPIEIGVKVKVTLWDASGASYAHTAWGQKDVSRYTKDSIDFKTKEIKYKKGDIIALFDDLKAAETDAVKKALSYFGIANDVYGGKEFEFFEDDSGVVDYSGAEAKQAFVKHIGNRGVLPSKIYEILKIKSLEEITNFKEAKDKVDAYLDKGGG